MVIYTEGYTNLSKLSELRGAAVLILQSRHWFRDLLNLPRHSQEVK